LPMAMNSRSLTCADYVAPFASHSGGREVLDSFSLWIGPSRSRMGWSKAMTRCPAIAYFDFVVARSSTGLASQRADPRRDPLVDHLFAPLRT
jgi:hypothetical protein